MNISAIQIPPLPQVSWSTVKAQDKEADFLSLRLLNKRTRIRIASQPLDLTVLDGRGNYFVVSNVKGWFAAIARDAQGESQLACSPLNGLRESIVSSKTDGEDELAPERLLPVAGAPTHLALALNDERLVVGLADGSISIFDTSSLFTQGKGNIEPLRTFPPGLPGPLRQIMGNPADLPDLVAVRRDAEGRTDGLAVEIFNVKQLQSVGGWRAGGTAELVPTSIVWSAKGKQLAIGLRNGDIVTYSPTDTNLVKLHVPKPPSVGDNSIITVLWLSNQAFYGIYAPPGNLSPEAPQKHVLTLFDPKTNSATQTELDTPYYASPALRPPGAFTVVMRNWSPARLLVFVGDSTSADIGLVGSLAESDDSETWYNLMLEETSTPSVPLDKNAEDTVPLALAMDLTLGQNDQGSSSSPVVYLYASDGTLQAWYVSNEKGGPYPGMVVSPSASTSSTSHTIQPSDKPPAAPSVLAQPTTTAPSFGSTGFGLATPKLGQAPSSSFASTGFASPAGGLPSQPEGSKPAFGQTSAPAFGSSAFGQQASTPAFGQASAFGQSANTSAFGTATQSTFGQSPATGFSAFASSGPSRFGLSSFGFGSSSPSVGSPSTGPAKSLTADVTSTEADMSGADEGEGVEIGGLALGGAGDTTKSQDGAVNSMFGSFAHDAAQKRPTTTAFGGGTGTSSFGAFGSAQGSSFVKPATGFGTFLKTPEPQSMPKDPSPDKDPKPSSAFGTSGFGSVPPAFNATAPVPSGGAFGNLTTTPSIFKPSEGFGAFGASVMVPSTSPFANPRPVTVNAFSTPVKSVSAFGIGGSGPASTSQTPTASSATPKFGTPSTPGGTSVFGKSYFGTPATPSPASTTPLVTPAGNAFSAYSTTGGFSAFAKMGKPSSFSDVLKAKKDGDGSPSTSSKTPMAGKEEGKDELSFVTIPKSDELDQDNLPPTPSTHGTFDDEDQDLGDEQGEEHDDADSFLSELFSGGSDGLRVEGQEEGEVEEDDATGSESESESGSEASEEVPAAETPSRPKTQSPSATPSPSIPDAGDSTPKSTHSFEKKPEWQAGPSSQSADPTTEQAKPPPVFSKSDTAASTKSVSPMPIAAPLLDDDDAVAKRSKARPKSPPPLFAKAAVSGIPTLFGKLILSGEIPSAGTAKSTSTSPSPIGKQAEPLNVNDSAAKPPAQSLIPKSASSVRSRSTTPPGSPSKPEDEEPLPAPRPVAPIISASPSLGLGRPGSRPTRSSPLAGMPVSGEESKVPPINQTSQSAPLFPRAHPASPRIPFGQTSDAVVQQRPALPSLPKPEDSQPQTTISKSPVSGGSLATSSKPTQLGASPQSLNTLPSTFKSPSLVNTQSPSPIAGNAPFIMPSSAPAGLSDKPGVSATSTTGFKAPGAMPQQVTPRAGQQLPVQIAFESGMQRECQALYMSMVEEFEQLAKTSQAAAAMRTMLGRPSTFAHSRQDLRDKTKWSFGDLEAFGKLTRSLEKDVLAAYQVKDELVPLMRELESNLLKAETRKEEIVRFSKAKADPDFARMLKARTLGPDVAETQSQLRKHVRLINDRVEQLEAHLISCKKRLEEHRKGKSSIKPPSLDTVNRTYRNIDLTIESQTEQIKALASRIANLGVETLDTALHGSLSPGRGSAEKGSSSSSHSSARSDGRESVFRPQVTPSIAASTAAALNAERSALRLKNALSNARRIPLLNTQAAEPARRTPTLDSLSRGGNPGLFSGLAGTLAPDLDSSKDYTQEREQDAAGESQRRPTRHFAHAKSVKLGKTHAQVPSSIATFDWGPLPKAKPMATLPSDIRPETVARNASS